MVNERLKESPRIALRVWVIRRPNDIARAAIAQRPISQVAAITPRDAPNQESPRDSVITSRRNKTKTATTPRTSETDSGAMRRWMRGV